MDPTHIQTVADAPPQSGGIIAGLLAILAGLGAAMLRGLQLKPPGKDGDDGSSNRELLQRIDRTLAAHVAKSDERHEAVNERFAGMERWNKGQDDRIDDLAQKVHAITAVDNDRHRRN